MFINSEELRLLVFNLGWIHGALFHYEVFGIEDPETDNLQILIMDIMSELTSVYIGSETVAKIEKLNHEWEEFSKRHVDMYK